MTDLWPDDMNGGNVKAPVKILREQAALLGQKTSNVVKASVKPVPEDFAAMLSQANKTIPSPTQSSFDGDPITFRYSFNIEAPTLNYTFRAFIVSHSIALYPVFFDLDGGFRDDLAHHSKGYIKVKGFDAPNLKIVADDEEQFMAILGEILASTRIRNVVGALLAQTEEPDIPF